MLIALRPSEIKYSQDNIGNVFYEKSNHSDTTIGETLDDIVEGRCSINDIPRISVIRLNQQWVSCDNRRLWIFKHLERLGICQKIHVRQSTEIRTKKLNSTSDGNFVRVRGSGPGGYWHQGSAYEVPYIPNRATSNTSAQRQRRNKGKRAARSITPESDYTVGDGWFDEPYSYHSNNEYTTPRYDPPPSSSPSGGSGSGDIIIIGLVLFAAYLYYKLS